MTILETTTIPGTTPVDDPYLGPLRYDWPSHCSVGVTEEAFKDGDTVKFSYRLTVSPRGAGRLVAFEEFEVLELNHKYPPPEHQAFLDSYFALPSFAVNRDGIASALPVGDDSRPSESESNDPPTDIYNLALQRFDEDDMVFWYWRPMVEEWIHLGEVFTPSARWTEPLAIDDEYEIDIIVKSIGTTTDTGRAILVHGRQLSGEALFRAIEEAPHSEAFDGAQLLDRGYDDGSWTLSTEVRTDPRTLLPERLDTKLFVTLWEGPEKEVFVETRKMRFDWDTADCSLLG